MSREPKDLVDEFLTWETMPADHNKDLNGEQPFAIFDDDDPAERGTYYGR